MRSIVKWFLGLGFLGELGQKLKGKKRIIGSLALLMYVLNAAPAIFPEHSVVLQEIARYLQEAFFYLGITLTPVGVADAVVKDA